ncbi:hypothetical protein MTR67_038579 [Solanum verrucosum]|uniref:Dof-type domain-containing protein n=1 Tax=Solanum verrucosum TaxID=315347 RepID=A0AAF0UH33_SOLVR|nr:hypothetical protein MTR67_038579 [Solanum verrucosum]
MNKESYILFESFKFCRRYWTCGSTLCNVPVGGGTRKNSSHKRPHINSSTGAVQEHTNPITMMGSGSGSMSLMGCEVNLNESVHEGGNGGFGLGLGLGGFGHGNLDWPMEQVSGGGNGGDGGENDKWQLSPTY